MRSLQLNEHLDLESTLLSGQAFRWRREPDGWYTGYIQNIPARVHRQGEALQWEGAPGLSAEAVRAYFALDGSHQAFQAGAPADPALRLALETFPGLHLLRQDPWEVFIAFILSQNSNVAKIARTIEALAHAVGSPLEFHGRPWHPFPTPTQLARLDDAALRATRMGYRAPHIAAAAQAVAEGRLNLERLSRCSYEDAKNVLLEVPGIGEKVADCILIYGCGHQDAFPNDVWISRVMRELYLPRGPLTHRRVGEFARQHFAPYAGYAQHYLFHYRRVVGPFSDAIRSNIRSRRRAASRSTTNRPIVAPLAAGNRTPS